MYLVLRTFSGYKNLSPGHAYSVEHTYASKDNKLRLVMCRNPWGNNFDWDKDDLPQLPMWKGSYGDWDDPNWTPQLKFARFVANNSTVLPTNGEFLVKQLEHNRPN